MDKRRSPAAAAPSQELTLALALTPSSSSSSSPPPRPPPKRRALSTERSRLCRQRQKAYAESLARHVLALRAELSSLALLRDLRREQSLQSARSPAGSAARVVREYFALFQHGIRPALDASPAAGAASLAVGGKRTRSGAAMAPLAPPAKGSPSFQREFLTSIMSPNLEVFDWIGRVAFGPGILVNGWKAWAEWHASLSYDLQRVHVVDTGSAVVDACTAAAHENEIKIKIENADENENENENENEDEDEDEDESELLVVQTESLLRVVVNETTLERLFPQAARDEGLRKTLLGKEICYEVKDTFYFSALERRVVKYSCDLDLVGALQAVAGNLDTALYLVTPPEGDSLSDLAIRTSPAARANRSPLDIDFLLT